VSKLQSAQARLNAGAWWFFSANLRARVLPKTIEEEYMDSSTSTKELEDRVAKLQRAVYHLIWKRTGFGEQCVHCGHAYPSHGEKCKAAEAEALVR
jgi:hypothetical protein